jgi:hypothetical protein
MNENELDMGYDEELAQIYEGREGTFPEGFGRVDGILTHTHEGENIVSEIDQGSYPIQNHGNMSLYHNQTYNVLTNNVIEKNTMRIPKIGPVKPQRITDGCNFTIFNPSDPPEVRYASGSNLVRSIAMALPENICAICNQGNCQEQAAKQWYGLFGWEFCHQKCWMRLCENYHKHLENFGNPNTTLNFIYFVPVPR